MPRIGSHITASRAVEAYDFYMNVGCIPDGWSVLGQGSFRIALLHEPSGVVYKVENGYGDDGHNNIGEWATARLLRKMVWERVRIPATTLYQTTRGKVLAMESVVGVMGSASSPAMHSAARKEMFEKGQLADMHGENFIFDTDGYLVPIDMGAERVSHSDGWSYADDRVLTAGFGSVG
jgi:hypothetical protein